jgi:hypothetical protein
MQREKTKPVFSESEIHEGEGRFPWWIWIAILIWLVYAFLIGPFHITGPQG